MKVLNQKRYVWHKHKPYSTSQKFPCPQKSIWWKEEMVAGGTDEFTLFSSWRKTKKEVNMVPFKWLKFKEKLTVKTLPADADDFMLINYTIMEIKVRILMHKVFELLTFCNMSNTVAFIWIYAYGVFMWGFSSVEVFSFFIISLTFQ